MRYLKPSELRFLRELAAWDGVATAQKMKNAGGGFARSTCKRWGLVTYDGTASNNGYWRITDAGRAALVTNGSREGAA